MVRQSFHSDDESSSERAPQMVRVRIPPSPTGIPHIGNTRTALFNFLFARHHKGKFFLRIEDTDQKRLVPESKEAIFEILRWLGLDWDGDVVVQSERLALYKDATEKLLALGQAKEDEGAVRFIVPKGRTVQWQDAVGSKDVLFKTDDVEDFIILKSDGFPTYHLANVMDDHAMEITHVMRGEEWISSTPKHILLYEAFGWKLPVFAHLPVILGPDHQKLSKRHGAKSALDYREEGYVKEALLNYMALLGWNPGGDQEIMDLETMIKLFDLKDVNTANPIFDSKKLLWLNGVYIRQASPDELKSKIKMQNAKVQFKIQNIDEEILNKLIPLAQTRMTTLNDFYPLIEHFIHNVDIVFTQQEKDIAKNLSKRLSTLTNWNKDEIFAALKEIMQKHNVRMPVLYKIFTGNENGLPLPESLEILGKEKTLQRLLR